MVQKLVDPPSPARVLLKTVREEVVTLTAQRSLGDGGGLPVTQLVHDLELVVILRPGKLRGRLSRKQVNNNNNNDNNKKKLRVTLVSTVYTNQFSAVAAEDGRVEGG